MTTQIKIVLGSILLLVVAMASAQTQPVRVRVPFSFFAGDEKLPAGDYTIAMTLAKDTMFLRSATMSTTIALPIADRNVPYTDRSDRTAKPDQSYLLFQRYGEHYILAEVWKEGTGQLITIPGKIQRELAHNHSVDRTARVEVPLFPQ